MDRMAVDRALLELRRRAPHLPVGPDLARRVHRAWVSEHDAAVGVQRRAMAAVVAVTWQAGFAAGAVRGHELAVAGSRVAVADRIARDVAADGEVHWLVHAAARAVGRLPSRPEVALRSGEPVPPVVAGGSWRDDSDQLAAATRLGLEHGWRAGHRAAVDAAVDALIRGVVDLVGNDAVVTTFLDAATPAYAWLEQVTDAVMAGGRFPG